MTGLKATVTTAEKSQPDVWLLLDGKPGHQSQVIGFADLMGWRAEHIALRFNGLNYVPNPVLGGSLFSLKKDSKAQLQKPWPFVIVSMGRKSLPVARWIKKQSGGFTKVILLGRKGIAEPDEVDLLVSCKHFQQLPREGLFELSVPPTKMSVETLETAKATLPDPFAHREGKRVLVLVGGPTSQHQFDESIAQRFAEDLLQAAHRMGGELTFLTSRRTPEKVVAALQAHAPKAHFFLWSNVAGYNPYIAYLAYSDVIVVSGESESMIAEAVATQKPLTIYALPEKPLSAKQRVIESAYRSAKGSGPFSSFFQSVFTNGWIVPPRNLNLMYDVLGERQHARMFTGAINTVSPQPNKELEALREEAERL